MLELDWLKVDIMDNQHLVVINSGSSSIKFTVYELNETLNKQLDGIVENIHIEPTLKLFDQHNHLIKEQTFPKDYDYPFFFEFLLSTLKSSEFQFNLVAAGHRVVHGGREFYEPVLISDELIQKLKKFIPFVPLHQPYNLEAIEVLSQLSPELKQIACFDTAFHRTHPSIADTFAIPHTFTEEGIKRYGFHGLSYEFIMHQLHEQRVACF